MRVVFVANWWYRRGGLGSVMLDEAAALALRGHEVIPFAARHPINLSTPWDRFFPAFHETGDLGDSMSALERLQAAARLIRNGEASRAFVRLLDEASPDVIHLHNTVRQLSPAVLKQARMRRIPVVMTLHDYALVCPQGHLLKGERTPCVAPNCLRGNPLPVVVGKCIRRRFLPSTVAAVEYGLHRAAGSYTRAIALALAPSRFMEATVASGGFPRRRLRYLPNGIAPAGDIRPIPREGGLILFSGRLGREKGLDVLLAAARLVPGIPITIAGDGPLRAVLEASAPPSVRFVGHLAPPQLDALRSEAVATVSPSTWYENAPIAVLESMRDGRPAVVSRIGGQPELVAAGGGLVVEPGNAQALADAITSVWNDRNMADRIGRAGWESQRNSYTLDLHTAALEGVYSEVVETGRPELLEVP
jgi:glycosyltransferase involved in cell wall biosynthesis